MQIILNFLDVVAWGVALVSSVTLYLSIIEIFTSNEIYKLFKKYGPIVLIEEVKAPAIGLFVSLAWLSAPYV